MHVAAKRQVEPVYARESLARFAVVEHQGAIGTDPLGQAEVPKAPVHIDGRMSRKGSRAVSVDHAIDSAVVSVFGSSACGDPGSHRASMTPVLILTTFDDHDLLLAATEAVPRATC